MSWSDWLSEHSSKAKYQRPDGFATALFYLALCDQSTSSVGHTEPWWAWTQCLVPLGPWSLLWAVAHRDTVDRHHQVIWIRSDGLQWWVGKHYHGLYSWWAGNLLQPPVAPTGRANLKNWNSGAAGKPSVYSLSGEILQGRCNSYQLVVNMVVNIFLLKQQRQVIGRKHIVQSRIHPMTSMMMWNYFQSSDFNRNMFRRWWSSLEITSKTGIIFMPCQLSTVVSVVFSVGSQ